MKFVEPQWRNSVAGPWATPSVCIEWMKQRSSTRLFVSGNSSDPQRPDCPCRANFQRGFITRCDEPRWPANARAPKPQALSCRNRRRLNSSTGSSLVHVPEFRRREERVKDRRPPLLGLLGGPQMSEGDGGLPIRRTPAQRQPPSPDESRAVIRVLLREHASGRGARLVEDEGV